MSEFERQIKEAKERAQRDAAEGKLREPITALRVEAEAVMLADRKGLSDKEAKTKLGEHLLNNDLSVSDFQLLPNREKFRLVREAFAD